MEKEILNEENETDARGKAILDSVSQLTLPKVAGVAMAEFGKTTTNPWTDALKSMNKPYDYDKFVEVVNLCRFFYRTEPVVSTVVNKLVEIGINDLVFSKNGLSDNEFRVFSSLKPKLIEYAEQLAQEFLLSGLVVPNVGYKKLTDKNQIFALGVKKLTSLTVPDSMSVRDPKTVKIYTYWLSDKPAYYIKIPDDVIKFIQDKGKFGDAKEDKELFEELKKFYPEFVKLVLKGETEIRIEEDSHILRRKYTSDNAYPIPYIASSLDALQHKRKLRRMDYSLIDKIISAILHVKVGNDEYPITSSPEDTETLTELRNQLRMRGNSEQLMERIFQLITNHTVDINWVFPDSAILSDTDKYSDINQEILFGLGFPRVLITGESSKTGTSDPELAMISPIKTMENFRRKIIEIIRDICIEVSIRNKFKRAPEVEFKALSLHSFKDFIEGLSKLYDTSSLSRTTLAKVYGVDFLEQLDLLEVETKELESRDLPLYGPNPFSANNAVEKGKTVNDTSVDGKDSKSPSDGTPKPATDGKVSNNGQ